MKTRESQHPYVLIYLSLSTPLLTLLWYIATISLASFNKFRANVVFAARVPVNTHRTYTSEHSCLLAKAEVFTILIVSLVSTLNFFAILLFFLSSCFIIFVYKKTKCKVSRFISNLKIFWNIFSNFLYDSEKKTN